MESLNYVLSGKMRVALGGLAAVGLGLLAGGWLLGHPWLGVGLLVWAGTVGVGGLLVARLHGLGQRLPHEVSQVESLLAIYHTLPLERGLPPTRGWAASADFLRVLMDVVLDVEPMVVVEASSGASTQVIAACLKKAGRGHVWSLEHDRHYAAETRRRVERQGLADWSTVLDAPLVSQGPEARGKPWYELSGLELPSPIDVLVVDGPPSTEDGEARLPALALLRDRLADGAVVLHDDPGRVGERAIIRQWLEAYPEFVAEWLPVEKVACLLLRKAAR